MARKLRLEFPGACYHVLNRGNYRSDIFESNRTKAAFEQCLFQACEKSAWLLHAFTIMRNHYHLVIETPQGNLVAGMQWLQATFANRFNRHRGAHGHLFQGRYKAFPVEEGEPLALVAHYVHLNPVRAGIVPVDRLGEYRYGSYWYLRRKAQRPPWLRLDLVLAQTGGLVDAIAGWMSYEDYLRWQTSEGPLGQRDAYKKLSQGWALGSAEFKAALLKDHAVLALARAWENTGAREIREQAWEDQCRRALAILGRSEPELECAPGRAPWKVALAAFLKERSQASNSWLGRRLHIGCAKYVSRLASGQSRAATPSPQLASLRGHGET
jgi:putative transposase